MTCLVLTEEQQTHLSSVLFPGKGDLYGTNIKNNKLIPILFLFPGKGDLFVTDMKNNKFFHSVLSPGKGNLFGTDVKNNKLTPVLFLFPGKGDLFGTDVKNDHPVNISACDVRSLAYCEILCMSIRAILEDISLYPEFSAKFTEDLPHNLTYNLREGADEWDSSVRLIMISRTL